jgi:putative flippase GtrA
MALRARVVAALARHRSLVLFAVVGGSGVVVNMAVYLGALAVFDALALDPSGRVAIFVAATLGWLVSVASNFALNDRFTFRPGAAGYQRSPAARLLRYYSSASVAYAVQAGVLFASLAAIEEALASAPDGAIATLGELAFTYRRTVANLVGILVATGANYLLARHWVFRANVAD